MNELFLAKSDVTNALGKKLYEYEVLLRTCAEAGQGRQALFEPRFQELKLYFEKIGLSDLVVPDVADAWYRLRVAQSYLGLTRFAFKG